MSELRILVNFSIVTSNEKSNDVTVMSNGNVRVKFKKNEQR